MQTMVQPVSSASIAPAGLLDARQLGGVVQRWSGRPADWLHRVRLNPADRWYERLYLDESHEVWAISWLPGQGTGFHDHGDSSGAFAVVLGTLTERRVAGAAQVLARPVRAGGSRAFGPGYLHDVRNTTAAEVAVSVHAYSPPLPAMTRYELTAGGLVKQVTEVATDW
jgi:predicted metal-dependent enzyme (double-stranded beta helix superfamily)